MASTSWSQVCCAWPRPAPVYLGACRALLVGSLLSALQVCAQDGGCVPWGHCRLTWKPQLACVFLRHLGVLGNPATSPKNCPASVFPEGSSREPQLLGEQGYCRRRSSLETTAAGRRPPGQQWSSTKGHFTKARGGRTRASSPGLAHTILGTLKSVLSPVTLPLADVSALSHSRRPQGKQGPASLAPAAPVRGSGSQ